MNLSAFLLAYLIAAAGLLALAGWAAASYRKEPSPLVKYLGYSALLASLYFILNSVPFLFTNNLSSLKLAINLGDIFYYATVLMQARLIWYLRFPKANFRLFLVPVLLLSLLVYSAYVYNIWHTSVTLGNGMLNYSWPTWALRLDALLASLFVVTGIFLARLVRAATTFRGKLRIVLLSAVFVIGGINGIYNTLFLRGLNNSPILYGVYIVVFGILLVTSTIGRIQKSA